jgi:hypothetical protein
MVFHLPTLTTFDLDLFLFNFMALEISSSLYQSFFRSRLLLSNCLIRIGALLVPQRDLISKIFNLVNAR